MVDYSIRISEEIDRIVDSPYPTQLKSLRDILCSAACSDADVKYSVLLRRCKADRLVTCLVEGLRQWPYILDIITRLACDITIRDSLLRRAPSLLHDITIQATKRDHIQSKYTSAAVSLLSHRLPSDYALPSEVQTLFLQLLEYAVQHPSVASIKPVYDIMKGCSNLLLGILSPDLVSRFEGQLMAILRSSTVRQAQEQEDQCLTLYCLNIMRVASIVPQEQNILSPGSWNTQDLLSNTQPGNPNGWNIEGFRDFFCHSGKALKTLQLLVLRVMDALRTTNTCSTGEIVEVLTLANDLLFAIPVELRHSWCQGNTAAIQRLQQRASVKEVQPELRILAFSFVVQLCKSGSLTPSVVEYGRAVFAQPDALALVAGDDALSAIFMDAHAVEEIFDTSTASHFCQNLLDLLTKSDSFSIIQASSIICQIVRGVGLQTHDSNQVSNAMVEAIAAPAVVSRLLMLLDMLRQPCSSTFEDTCRTTLCSVAVQNARSQVCYELSACLLKCALGTGSASHQVSAGTLSILLEIHGASAQHSRTCSHTQSATRLRDPTYTFIEESSTPDEHNLDWRIALEKHFQSKAVTDHTLVSDLLTKACADLESRCENVEQPLITLQAQYDELSAAYSELEIRGIDTKLRLDGLEAEKEGQFNDLASTRERADGLVEKISQLETALRKSQDEAEQMISRMRNDKRQADLEHATILARKEEELELAEESKKSSKTTLKSKEAELDSLRSVLDGVKAEADGLRYEKENLNAAIRDQLDRINTLEHDVSDVKRTNAELEASKLAVATQIEEERQRFHIDIERVTSQAKQNMDDVQALHDSSIEQLSSTHAEELEALRSQFEKVRDDQQRSTDHHRSEIAKLDDNLTQMHHKVDRLNQKCKQKDAQIAEANAMRINLMKAMGLGGHQAMTQTSSHGALPQRTKSSGMEMETDPSPPTPASAHPYGETGHGKEDDSFASSASGSTPKRPRTRKSFRVPSPAKSRRSIAPRTSLLATKETTQRQPLLSLSVNRSPRRMPSTKKGKPVSMAEFEFDEGSTFDDQGSPIKKDDFVNLEGLLDIDTETQLGR